MSSLLRLLLDSTDELSESSFRPTNEFGYGIHPNDIKLISTVSTPCTSRSIYNLRRNVGCRRRRPHAQKFSNEKRDIQIIGKFQVAMDVREFAPNDISVKTVNNNIVVEAKHEEREDDHGYVSQQFTRRYNLPEGYNIEDVVTKLSSDGVLTVEAPPEEKTDDGSKVRVIQIQQTGPGIENVAEDMPSSQEEMNDSTKQS